MADGVILRPPIIVARPRDWTATLASVVLGGVLVMLAVIGLLVRLPDAAVDAALGQAAFVRAGLLLVSLWILSWLSTLVHARLPRAAYRVGRSIVFPEHGGRRRIDIREVDEIVVERRPAPVGEVLVLRMVDGTTREVCPTGNPGAARLYASIARTLDKRAKKLGKPKLHRPKKKKRPRKHKR